MKDEWFFIISLNAQTALAQMVNNRLCCSLRGCSEPRRSKQTR